MHTATPMQRIQLRTDRPCVLVDTSYYVFYRFYDTLKKCQETLSAPGQELSVSPVFLRQLYWDMNADFGELLRGWKTVPSNVIFCKDCSRKTIWRNHHTNAYKSQRPTKSNFTPQMFSLMSQFCYDRRLQTLGLDHLEADDVIALTKKHLRMAGFQAPIILITNDNDYLQLLDERTHAYNMNHERNNLRDRSTGNPKLDLRMKIIMGDRSDNIPPIQPKIGPKRALQLAQMPEEDFQAYLQRHQCREAFERNTQLIDLDAIRPDLKQRFQEAVEFQLFTPRFNVY